LTPASRLRLVQRCQVRPIAHVAAEAGIRELPHPHLDQDRALSRIPTPAHPPLHTPPQRQSLWRICCGAASTAHRPGWPPTTPSTGKSR